MASLKATNTLPLEWIVLPNDIETTRHEIRGPRLVNGVVVDAEMDFIEIVDV